MKKKLFVSVIAIALMLCLTGCGIVRPDEDASPTVQPQATSQAQIPAENEEPSAPSDSPEPADTADPGPSDDVSTPEPENNPGRQDGERFETVVVIEGEEETVKYEHVKNETIGFEMDYDYEILERHAEPDRERFISSGEDPEDPWDYFEVRYDPQDANAAAAAVNADLSDAYNSVSAGPHTLAGAGQCIRIAASGAKDGKVPMSSLETVYIVPAGDGCLIAAVHCTFESAGGFGIRVDDILNTLSVIGK